jgi:hypothetical protein
VDNQPTVFVCPGDDFVRNANAERQRRFRGTPQGRAAAAARNLCNKLKRQAAKRLYHQQRRSAVADCSGAGKRVRDVGAEGVNTNAVHDRFLKEVVGWQCAWPREGFARG